MASLCVSFPTVSGLGGAFTVCVLLLWRRWTSVGIANIWKSESTMISVPSPELPKLIWDIDVYFSQCNEFIQGLYLFNLGLVKPSLFPPALLRHNSHITRRTFKVWTRVCAAEPSPLR